MRYSISCQINQFPSIVEREIVKHVQFSFSIKKNDDILI